MAKKIRPPFRELQQKLTPATHESLMLFRHSELKQAAMDLKLLPQEYKLDTVNDLMNSGKVSLCSSIAIDPR